MNKRSLSRTTLNSTCKILILNLLHRHLLAEEQLITAPNSNWRRPCKRKFCIKIALGNQSLSDLLADELLHHLIEQEWDDRQNRAVDRTLRNAKYRYKANIQQLVLSQERSIDKKQILCLAQSDYLNRAGNMIITGSTGTGKSYLTSALGHQACLKRYKVFYASTSRLLSQIKMAKADGSDLIELVRLERTDLLILDDYGIQPFDHPSRLILTDIINDKHGKKSTIYTSPLTVVLWHDIIRDKIIANAILDRVVYNASRIKK